MPRWLRAINAGQKTVRRWVIRIVAAYFGYKILHHEIYDVTSSDLPLLFLGLWLLGIAPADVFDGLRKAGEEIGRNIDKASAAEVEQATAATTAERESRDKRSGDHQA